MFSVITMLTSMKLKYCEIMILFLLSLILTNNGSLQHKELNTEIRDENSQSLKNNRNNHQNRINQPIARQSNPNIFNQKRLNKHQPFVNKQSLAVESHQAMRHYHPIGMHQQLLYLPWQGRIPPNTQISPAYWWWLMQMQSTHQESSEEDEVTKPPVAVIPTTTTEKIIIKNGRDYIKCGDCSPSCNVYGSSIQLLRLDHYGNGLFYIPSSGESVNWREAEQKCQALFNGHLASFHSRQEFDFVIGKAKEIKPNTEIAWIGLESYRILFGHGWKWIDGTPQDWRVPWRSGEPNNNGGGNGVYCFMNDRNFNDEYDSSKLSDYICKKKCF